ncbi:hypothetical protein PIROE2DRAFT_17754 [Piromyces sp. E2]|nr:hypothetical protein PIROE2DRAFT_17754 [Piromyces sp. E2]|eukprot:OUM57309.1 hypothetical protein PIROE2DRAFT_17754 [Piromyces sp. E2]
MNKISILFVLLLTISQLVRGYEPGSCYNNLIDKINIITGSKEDCQLLWKYRREIVTDACNYEGDCYRKYGRGLKTYIWNTFNGCAKEVAKGIKDFYGRRGQCYDYEDFLISRSYCETSLVKVKVYKKKSEVGTYTLTNVDKNDQLNCRWNNLV